jgi:hypothetical protein
MKPKQSDTFRENAQNCADKAENTDEPSYSRRMCVVLSVPMTGA